MEVVSLGERAFDHIYLAVKPKIGTCHAHGSSPLSGACLRSNALKSLFFGIIRLGDSRIELMTSGSIVALELIIYLRRGAERLLQEIRPHQRRRTIHLVEIQNLLRDIEIRCVIVQFLTTKLFAEDWLQLIHSKRLAGRWIQKRRRLVLHIGTNIIPLGRNLILSEIDFVRNFLFHDFILLVDYTLYIQKFPAAKSRQGIRFLIYTHGRLTYYDFLVVISATTSCCLNISYLVKFVSKVAIVHDKRKAFREYLISI